MQLRIPGPTPCPPEALEASGRQMTNHRGKEFFALIEHVTDGLKAEIAEVMTALADVLPRARQGG